MVGGYFSDILDVLNKLRSWISQDGSVWMVVGDSRYAGIQIQTAEIIAELAPQVGWQIDRLEPCRSMRASAQQGGQFQLSETLIVLSTG